MSEMAWLLRLVRSRAHHVLIFHPLSPGVTQSSWQHNSIVPVLVHRPPLSPHALSSGCDNSLGSTVSSFSSVVLVYQFWDWQNYDFLLELGRLSHSLPFPPIFRVRVVSEAQGDLDCQNVTTSRDWQGRMLRHSCAR